MKNHFIISYAGNKRQEVEFLHKFLKDKLVGISTIVEPFCGTSAMSVYLSMKYPKKFKYILNDFDEHLVALYHLMQNEEELTKFTIELNEKVKLITNKENYLAIIKEPTILAWFIKHKIYSIRAGLYQMDYKPKIYNFEDLEIVKFLRTEDVSIGCDDGCDVVKQYKNNSNCLLLIDPPYLMSCNSFYKTQNTNIYEYCVANCIADMNSLVVFVLEDNWILRLLFGDKIKTSYGKTYNIKQKKTSHMIICNK